MTTLTRVTLMSSSSATTCAIAVSTPWPMSILPKNAVTCTVRIHGDPGVETRGRKALGCRDQRLAPCTLERQYRQPASRCGDEQQTGTALQKLATVRMKGAHARSVAAGARAAFMESAARRTARRIDMCVPQRHLSPASPARISASVSAGLRSSRATVVMIQPLVQ